MNRALLLVICDFLILSILALVRFEEPTEEPAPEPPVTQTEAAEADLVELLRESLEEAALDKEELAASLEARDETLAQREETLAEREARLREIEEQAQALSTDLEATAEALAEREAAMAELDARLAERQAEATSLAAERERLSTNLEQTREALMRAERERAQLATTASSTREEAAAAKARAELLEQQLQERAAQMAAADERLAELAEAREAAERARASAVADLRIREAEKDILAENLRTAQTEIAIVREEKARIEEQAATLATGVTELASESEALREEVRAAQPLSANQIFAAFRENRATLTFTLREQGVFGTSDRSGEVRTLFVRTANGAVYALAHRADTPLGRANFARLTGATGQLEVGEVAYSLGAVSFLREDLRILAIRVDPTLPATLGREVFDLAEDPLRFPDAVLIGNAEAYYGEAPFRLTAGREDRVEVERRLFSRLFGEFSPRAGDLVFTRQGQLMGVMVTDEEAAVLRSLTPLVSLPLGEAFSAERAAEVAAALE